MNFWWRLRLFVGGELVRLGGWIVPKVGSGDSGCDEMAEWAIYGERPDDETFSCTSHLSEMIATDTKAINKYYGAEKCHYVYSADVPEYPEVE